MNVLRPRLSMPVAGTRAPTAKPSVFRALPEDSLNLRPYQVKPGQTFSVDVANTWQASSVGVYGTFGGPGHGLQTSTATPNSIKVLSTTAMADGTARVTFQVGTAVAAGERPSLMFLGPKGKGSVHITYLEVVK